MKNTFALGRGRDAVLSHHIGDLDDYHAGEAFCHEIDLYERLFNIYPEVITHDLHPDYASTHYAIERARHDGSRKSSPARRSPVPAADADWCSHRKASDR